MNKKQKLELCKQIAVERNGECLSEEFIDWDVKMQWRCSCGNEWPADFNHIKNRNQWCPKCGLNKRKQNNLIKYGVEYVSQLDDFKEKIKKTSLERYGVEHFTQSKKVQENFKQNCLKKFGVENPQQNKDIQEKTKDTCLEKYGTSCPFENNEVKEKIKQTCLERYGVDHPQQNKNIQEKTKQTCINKYGVNNPFENNEIKDKIKKTCLERYGYISPLCNKEVQEKCRKTYLDRYGVDNPTKNREIALKAAKKVNKPSIKYHWKTNEELNCQGGYEASVVDYLNKNQINYIWQPKPVDLSNGSTYRPDLLLTDQNIYIEIKGYFRPDALAKWTEFRSSHHNSELWDEKKLKSLKILK